MQNSNKHANKSATKTHCKCKKISHTEVKIQHETKVKCKCRKCASKGYSKSHVSTDSDSSYKKPHKPTVKPWEAKPWEERPCQTKCGPKHNLSPLDSTVLSFTSGRNAPVVGRFIGQGNQVTDPFDAGQNVPCTGAITQIDITLSGIVFTGPYTYTLYKNGAPTSVVITILPGHDTASVLTNVPGIRGDYFSFGVSAVGTPIDLRSQIALTYSCK